MDLNLKDFVSILDIVKKLSWGSMPLWLAIGVPVYYTLIRKIIPENEREPGNTNLSLKARVLRFFSTPRFEKWVIGVSVGLFIIGSFTVIWEQQCSELVRNNGLRIKKQMIAKNFYIIPTQTITGELGIKDDEIRKVLKQYPNEFLLIKSTNSGKDALLLTDSALYSRILSKSKQILEAHLNNWLSPGNYVTMDNLFTTNNFFTYTVCFSLLADSPAYYYDRKDGKDCIARKL